MLIGRGRERGEIERLLQEACDGRSSALVLRGEPGVGKTTLLQYGLERAGSMQVVRATGIESEGELEYSGLLELLRPLLSRLDDLPEPQADALRAALGMGAGSEPDRFVVGAATLSLLAAAAEESPVLVLVDDAQWLDHASAGAIRFAARRLLADHVALLIATRPEGFEPGGLDELMLCGLDGDDVAELAAAAAGRPLPAAEAAALHAATGGNPLAVIELGRLGVASPAGLEPTRVTDAIERAFAGRLAVLPEESLRALCVVAAAAGDDPGTVVEALRAVGLEGPDLAPAEDVGLVAIDADSVRFAHPLLRSVAYHGRPPSERRAVHAALATASRGERRAWHLAAAAVGHDEAAAEALAASADAARARGGQVAAAAALERAARLTADAGLRAARLADAVDCAWRGGETRRAAALLDEALELAADGALRGRIVMQEARLDYHEGRQQRARELMLEAAAGVEDDDPVRAVRILGFAVQTCFNEGLLDEAVGIAQRGRALAEGIDDGAVLHADYVVGRALHLRGRVVEAEPLLTSVVDRLQASGAASANLAVALAVLERADEANAVAHDVVESARRDGPLPLLHALAVAGALAVRSGEWRSAEVLAAEGLDLARQLDQGVVVAVFLSFATHLQAARGQEEGCRAGVAEALALCEASGSAVEAERVRCTLGLLELGLDRLDAATATLAEAAAKVDEMTLFDRDIAPEPDLFEVHVRAGRPREAEAVLGAWVARGATDAGPWFSAVAARCRALLAPDDEVDALFARALELHDAVPDPFQRARTSLLQGERLRRAGRRIDSRGALREALVAFEALGAASWSERARRELRASGEKLRREASSGDELTPQELQIALQVAEGKANKEVAAALYLSPKTVEFHLSRIYRKLELASRSELVRQFATPAP